MAGSARLVELVDAPAWLRRHWRCRAPRQRPRWRGRTEDDVQPPDAPRPVKLRRDARDLVRWVSAGRRRKPCIGRAYSTSDRVCHDRSACPRVPESACSRSDGWNTDACDMQHRGFQHVPEGGGPAQESTGLWHTLTARLDRDLPLDHQFGARVGTHPNGQVPVGRSGAAKLSRR